MNATAFATPNRGRPGPRPAAADIDTTLMRVRLLADLLDQRFRIPGTSIRFGLDALIGVLPFVGDTVTAIAALYPVAEAVRLGVRGSVIVRMLVNVGFDWLIGLIPLVDLVFDVAFKANMRNLHLLEREMLRTRLR